MKLLFFNLISEVNSLGLLHVVTYLENNGYLSKYVYIIKQEGEELDQDIKVILSFIKREKPDLIGFSFMTCFFYRARKLTIDIKKNFPKIPVLWGGIHATVNPNESIKYADYVCVGEGEDATLELMRAFEKGSPKNNIANIWSKRNGEIIKNDVRTLIQNLDRYPYPKINWENTYCLNNGKIVPLTTDLYRKYNMYDGKMYDVIISRGCPYSCSYCSNSHFKQIYRNKGKYVRSRSVDNVISEFKYIKETFPFVNMINIQDDCFAALSETYLKEFAEKKNRISNLPLRLRLVPTHINETKLKHLRAAKTLVACMGLQANDRINKEIFNRHAKSDDFLKTARLLPKYNIVGQYDLIIKNPFATEKDMVEICQILAKIPKCIRSTDNNDVFLFLQPSFKN